MLHRMKWTNVLVWGAVLISVSEGSPNGGPCINAAGEFAESWSRCAGTCCTEYCNCEEIDGRPQAICHTACAMVMLQPGCRLLDPFQNETHMECCRSECPEKSCQTSFGKSVPLNDRWRECLPGEACCFADCQCLSVGEWAIPFCRHVCMAVRLQEGCYIDEPFQNATHLECCNVKCTGKATGNRRSCRVTF